MTACARCGQQHQRKRFCSNACKDRWHNSNNPVRLARTREVLGVADNDNDDDADDAYWYEEDPSWDAHKSQF